MEAAAASPAPGSCLQLAITAKFERAQTGRWQHWRAEVLALAPAAANATAADVEETQTQDGARLLHFAALPVFFRREWAESIWANVSVAAPRLFFVFGADAPAKPLLTLAGDEAAGYGEVDATVLALPMPHWLLQKARAFVAAHYKPEIKKARKRQ